MTNILLHYFKFWFDQLNGYS